MVGLLNLTLPPLSAFLEIPEYSEVLLSGVILAVVLYIISWIVGK